MMGRDIKSAALLQASEAAGVDEWQSGLVMRALQPFRCGHWMLFTSRPLSLFAHRSRACSLPVTTNVYLRLRDFSELQSGARASEPL